MVLGWALGSLGALILARVLNVFVIKQRAKPSLNRPRTPPGGSTTDQERNGPPATATPSDSSQCRFTEYVVSLGDSGSSVRLRGTPDDLQAITTEAWLRAKTHIEGYLEATAKLLVYLVAAFSGNMTQAGSAIFMALLLVSAGLLALSNANAKSFRMKGLVAAPLPAKDIARILEGKKEGGLPRPQNGIKEDRPARNGVSRAGPTAVNGHGGLDDLAERGQAGTTAEALPPSRGSVNHPASMIGAHDKRDM